MLVGCRRDLAGDVPFVGNQRAVLRRRDNRVLSTGSVHCVLAGCVSELLLRMVSGLLSRPHSSPLVGRTVYVRRRLPDNIFGLVSRFLRRLVSGVYDVVCIELCAGQRRAGLLDVLHLHCQLFSVRNLRNRATSDDAAGVRLR